MEAIIIVSDRPDLRERLRRSLHFGTPTRYLSTSEWTRKEFRVVRERIFVLDLPTPDAVRRLLPIATYWPHGFTAGLVPVLGQEAVKTFEPSSIMDTFLVDPFSDAEASLRIRTLVMRRRAGSPPETLSFVDLVIDTGSYEVMADGVLLDLTYKEYELLRFLASNPARVFTRDILLSRVWGEDYYGGTRTVDVHVRRIRAKLGSRYEGFVQTVRNVGYRFSVPAEA